MYLTDEQQAILDGRQGELLQKTMETLVRYGEVYEADRMVELDGPVQLVCSFAMAPLRPFFKILGEFKAAGIKTKLPFTADPRPMDFENMGFHGNTVEETVYISIESAAADCRSAFHGPECRCIAAARTDGRRQGHPRI